MSEFDIVAHHRERTRQAELRADGADRHRCKLERIIVVLLAVATGNGRDADPLTLLAAVEAMIDTADALPVPGLEDTLQLLRDTDPARFKVPA